MSIIDEQTNLQTPIEDGVSASQARIAELEDQIKRLEVAATEQAEKELWALTNDDLSSMSTADYADFYAKRRGNTPPPRPKCPSDSSSMKEYADYFRRRTGKRL